MFIYKAFVSFNTNKVRGKNGHLLLVKALKKEKSEHVFSKKGLDIKAAQRDMGYQWEQVRILE